MGRPTFCFIVVLWLSSRALTASASEEHRFVLENGLRVVLAEDHRRPRVAVAVAYHAGFRDEPAGYQGIAHLTEHLMFHGSRHIPDDSVT